MKIKIVAVGRIKEEYYKQAVAEYVKRLGRFGKVEIIELDEILLPDELMREAKALSPKLSGFVIALDKFGEKLSSEQLADKIKDVMNTSSEICFVIGSSVGLDDSIKENADMLLSFGAITLPHSLARVVLTEQVYRAFSIISGGKYHK